jgi:stage V sporulation protein B
MPERPLAAVPPDKPDMSVQVVDAVVSRPAPSHTRASLATSAGALVAAKVVFVAAGYALYAGLSRLLSAEQFGTFLVVNSTVGVLNAVFITGTIQAVSRFVSRTPERAPAILATALRLQVVLSGALAGAYFLGAPLFASLLNDAGLTPFLRVSAIIPFAYASYAAMIGYANGLRRFAQQAGFDIAFSFLKITLVVALPWLGFGVMGAIGGFSAASVLILTAAWLVIGRNAASDRTSDVTPATILRFEATVMAHVAFTNLLMQLDLLMVKGLYAGEGASAAVGLYGAAAKLAQIPYSVLVALNFLIFPYVARSTAHSPKQETAGYIRQAFRLSVALSIGPAVVLAALSQSAVSFVFGAAYGAAGPVLTVLAGGYVLYSVLTLQATIINSSGRPGISLALTGATVAVQALLAFILIPSNGIVGAAIASSAAYLVGAAAATGYLIWKYNSVMPWTTFARTAVAAVVVLALSRTGLGSASLLVAAPALGIAYLLTLVALKEWNASELRLAFGRTPATS